MTTGSIMYDDKIFNSRLSFKPLIEAIKKMVAEGKPGSKKLYGRMIAEVESHPELLEPISDLSILQKHEELIEMLLATIFPPTTSHEESLYAVSLPFRYETIYSSDLFRHLFLKPGTNEVFIPDDETGRKLREEKLSSAYNMILKKYLGHAAPEPSSTVYPYADQVSGLTKYLELKIDARFVEIKPVNELPILPENLVCKRTNRVLDLEELLEKLPLEKFVFEGLVIVRVSDVTDQQVITEIKNSLLAINAFSDAYVYDKLQLHIQSLIGLKDLRIGITPFFKVNGYYVYSDVHSSNSLLYKQFNSGSEKDDVNECCETLFQNDNTPIVFEDLNEEEIKKSKYLKLYYQEGARSLIICPLKNNNGLIGVLEIISPNKGRLRHTHIARIESAIPLFTLALEKSAESLDAQIEKVIKEQFTAVQPVVEWKFTEAALNYISAKQQHEDVKMERIAFENVYPLYGAIDIRNSSVARANSIQLDLIEQLNMARAIIKKAQVQIQFPLLQEIEFKIDKYILSASDSLLSDEEMQIVDFLQNQVVSVLNHLKSTLPSVHKDLAEYFAAIDPEINVIYHHRKEYDESISKINRAIARFVDKEQEGAQQVFPHYFERYVTDGVEFNVYIGQSLAPTRKFDELYLRNMKMWHLTVLAKAAMLANELQAELSYPLQTTQLILAHSVPISISFRTDERKFDIDGAYNIRYEIIKKRIDKVRIKATNERLTQPGKIAIVYSQPKEVAEYVEYIEFLQNIKILKGNIEYHDLEELQGVLGLKALRIEVNFEDSKKENKAVELSNVTSGQLIGK